MFISLDHARTVDHDHGPGGPGGPGGCDGPAPGSGPQPEPEPEPEPVDGAGELASAALPVHGAEPSGSPGGLLPQRVEFWGDPPTATAVVALAFAVVHDSQGRVLLARRTDTGNWEPPGGRIEPGESVIDAVTREVAEETGLAITVTGLAGVFCDPSHVIVYPDTGEARQQHVTLVHAVPARSDPQSLTVVDQVEIDAAAWVELDELAALPIHPSVHRRLDRALRHHRNEIDIHLD